MTEQIMMLSLPNMGTDWIVDVIRRQNPGLRYYREFFNPATNHKHANALSTAFGSEMVSSYQHIADPAASCEEVYKTTWQTENYNFTKENYSPFKVKFFTERFNCFVLIRRTELVFPPSRPEVVTWYDAIYASLLLNSHKLDKSLIGLVNYSRQHADTINKRIVAACEICSRKLLRDARKEGLRILEYSDLMTMGEATLERYVEGVPGVIYPKAAAATIVGTRKHKQENFARLGATNFLANMRQPGHL